MNWNTTTDKIEKAYKEALDECRNLASQNPEVYTPRVASILNDLGVFYSDTQRFSEAEKVYSEALQIRRGLAEKNPNDYTHDVVVTLNNFGILYNDTQRFFEAEKTYKKALKIKKALIKHPEGADLDIAMILLNLGALYNDTQRFSEAEKAYKQALQIYRERTKENNGVYADIALTLNNLGALYIYTQEVDKAEKALIEALQIRRALEEENPEVHAPHVAMILKNLGILYINTQRFSEAEKVYSEALQIRRALEEQNPDVYAPFVAATLNSMGSLYSDTTQFDRAEKVYTEALQKYKAVAEKTPEVYTPDVAATLDNLGSLYTHTSKFSEAEKAYIEALQIRKTLAEKNPKVFNPDVALTLNNLGNLYTLTRKFFEAKKAYTEALQIRKTLAEENPEVHTPDIAMILTNLGSVYSDTKEVDKAEKALIEALQIRRTLANKNPEVHTPDIAMILTNLGSIYKDTKKVDKAEKAFSEAIQKYTQATLWFDTARSTYNLFTVTFDEKTLENSRRLLKMVILLSKEKRYKYVQKGRFENIYLALLHRGISTYGVLEALRDPELLSLLWDKILLQQELERAQSDVRFQKQMIEKILKDKVPCFGHIPAELPENALFIYIQELLDYVLFYVIEGDSSKKYKCKKEFLTTDDKLLRNLRIQQGAAQKTDDLSIVINKFEMYSKKWSEMLPEGIKELFQENDQIVFSPDSYCSFLPLEALQVDGKPLCMEKTVVRATSLHQFLKLLKKKPSLDSSLIVGNPWPQCDEEKLIYSLPSKPEYFRIPSLQNAQEEANALMGSLPEATVLLGEKATGERFLSEISRHSLIHFSGHGSMGRILFLSGPLQGFSPQFEPEEFSNLRIAERSDGKRINMMEEWHPVTDFGLFDVPLTDGAVVFLNACETGQHKYAAGGYYQGLPAVFLKNRAHSVVSSLVPIFDEPSKEFALHFYDNLLHTHSVSQSLKKARTWSKNKYKAQIYWIPYIHYGSPL